MKLDINNLINGSVGSLIFNNEVVIPGELIKTTEIRKLKNVIAIGKAIDAGEYGIELNMNIKGIMVLPCALTLEDVDYKFDVNVNENISFEEKSQENNSNILDITEIIWENIVLEIPLRVVKEGAKIKEEGDGWKLNLGEDDKIDPRLEKLKELYKEE